METLVQIVLHLLLLVTNWDSVLPDTTAGKSASSTNGSIADESLALEFLGRYNHELSRFLNRDTIADWNYSTNITNYNTEIKEKTSIELSDFQSEALKNASVFNTTNFSENTKRQFKQVGKQPLDPEEEQELIKIISKMGEIYGMGKVCLEGNLEESRSLNGSNDQECLNLEPGLTTIMAESTDFEKRTFVWKEWRRIVGRQLKPLYERYVQLKNKRSRLNNYKDLGDEWRSKYEMEDFEQTVLDLYEEIEPLYKELHAYVRRKLYAVYGKDRISLNGTLPASVAGDMWGRFWNDLYKHVVPYPDKPSVDPTKELIAQNYTVAKLFKTGDDFYASMGLLRVPPSFWKLSMLEKPTDGREVVCHATAWDFFDGEDFRIRMCTKDYNFDDLNTIHHELGHIQYQQQYKDQTQVFRDGANDGFHEAIGELMALSGATPKHLNKIGLLKELVEDDELDINFLTSQSLITISTLPFHLVNDLWRWRIFRGDVAVQNWNKEFWRLMESVAGVKSPVERTGEDLDPPTLFHVCQDYDMIRYFTRTLLQFQFAEALCKISGHRGPLHRCDFSGSKEAGEALAKMLRLGSSRPWLDALEQLTGERRMSARPILKFFEPLHAWLRAKNLENGDKPGWD